MLDKLKLTPTAANIMFFTRASRALAVIGILLLGYAWLQHWHTAPLIILLGVWAGIGFFFAFIIRIVLLALKAAGRTAPAAPTARRR